MRLYLESHVLFESLTATELDQVEKVHQGGTDSWELLEACYQERLRDLLSHKKG